MGGGGEEYRAQSDPGEVSGLYNSLGGAFHDNGLLLPLAKRSQEDNISQYFTIFMDNVWAEWERGLLDRSMKELNIKESKGLWSLMSV